MPQHYPPRPEDQPNASGQAPWMVSPAGAEASWNPIPGLDAAWAARPNGAAPQPGGLGTLVLHLLRPLDPLSAVIITPRVTIDGLDVPARWGANPIPVAAGPRTVTVEARYLWPYGRQQAVVNVPAGQTVEWHYSAPLVSFGAGAMGPTRQPRPGRVAFALILASPLLLVLLLFLLILFG
jgi:hypothetical protein